MKFFVWLALVVSLFMSLVQAAPIEHKPSPDPYATIHLVMDNTFKRLSAERVDSEEVPVDVLEQIIEQEMMPYVDYRYVAYKVVGRHLKETTDEQRNRFVQAFYSYLLSTYAQALGQYDDQLISIEPSRSLEDKSTVTIAAAIEEEGRPAINLTFKFRKLKKSGNWFAYDLIAEGVSLLSAKQSEIGPLINKQGIDSVSQMLEDKHNEQVEQRG